MKDFCKTPFVGINGADQFIDYGSYDRLAPIGSRTLMGILTSHRTQVRCEENKYGKDWYAVGKDLGDLATKYSILHNNYLFTDPDYVETFASLVYSRIEAHSGRRNVGGVQHNNLPWHITDYHDHFSRMRINMEPDTVILQATGEHLKDLTPAEFTKKLRSYGSCVSHVLFDESGSTGRPLDAEKLRPYIDSLYEAEDTPQVAIAGGINSDNLVELTGELLLQYPDLSIDAESGLRDGYSIDDPGKSKYSPAKAVALLTAYIELKKKHKAIQGYPVRQSL